MVQITPPQDMGKITQAQDVEVTQPQDMGKVTATRHGEGHTASRRGEGHTATRHRGNTTTRHGEGHTATRRGEGHTATRHGEDHSHKTWGRSHSHKTWRSHSHKTWGRSQPQDEITMCIAQQLYLIYTLQLSALSLLFLIPLWRTTMPKDQNFFCFNLQLRKMWIKSKSYR